MKCKDCVFWDIGDMFSDTSHQCRRYPPVMAFCQIEAKENIEGNGGEGVWPSTDENDWCGEFKHTDRVDPKNCGDLGMPARRMCVRLGIVTLEQLSDMSKEDLLRQKGIGVHAVNKIRTVLNSRNLSLRSNP